MCSAHPAITAKLRANSSINRSAGEKRQVVVERDDGIRPGTTPAALAQLKPAFKQGGSTTAGNSSQVRRGPGELLSGQGLV